MVRKVKVILSYNGKDYAGWQRQKGKRTLQKIVEETLSKILQEKIKVYSAGRTDSGVHALGQVISFSFHKGISLKKIKNGLNALLPSSLRIKRISYVPSSFHPRYDTSLKTYRYLILNSKVNSPFLKDYALFYPYKLNISAMRKGARFLPGRHNFISFQAAGSRINPALLNPVKKGGVKSPLREIKRISIKREKSIFLNPREKLISITITADGFLYKMVRNIVGTLLELGKEKLAPEDIKKILKKRDRRAAGPTAPACGLTLLKVNYKK